MSNENNTKKGNKSFTEVWQEGDLIRSGSKLAAMIGCSMPKIAAAIRNGDMGFPSPVKFKIIGQRKVNFYDKSQIEEFMNRIDLRTSVVKNQNAKHISEVAPMPKIDADLYFSFMGVNAQKLNYFGIGHYSNKD